MRANRLVLVHALRRTLVEQAKGAIKSTFVGLRVRDLQGDRKTRGSRSGDVYVTTWASVAATNKDTRKMRSGGEFVLALDDLIAELRTEGFRIGVSGGRGTPWFYPSGKRGRALLPRDSCGPISR
jgi:hypothetical protein